MCLCWENINSFKFSRFAGGTKSSPVSVQLNFSLWNVQRGRYGDVFVVKGFCCSSRASVILLPHEMEVAKA